VPQRAPPGLSCKILRREALQILPAGAGASYREILEKLTGMMLSQYNDAGSRPGWLWRGVVLYGTWKVPAPIGTITFKASRKSVVPCDLKINRLVNIASSISTCRSPPSTCGKAAGGTVGKSTGNVGHLAEYLPHGRYASPEPMRHDGIWEPTRYRPLPSAPAIAALERSRSAQRG
jgi:hypothetical protein